MNQVGAEFVYIDGLLSFMPRGKNPSDPVDVRFAMTPLDLMLKRRNAAALLTRHVGKMEYANAQHKGLGSVEFTNMARVGLLYAKHPAPEGQEITGLAVTKHNYSGPMPTLKVFGRACGNRRYLIDACRLARDVHVHGRNDGRRIQYKGGAVCRNDRSLLRRVAQ